MSSSQEDRDFDRRLAEARMNKPEKTPANNAGAAPGHAPPPSGGDDTDFDRRLAAEQARREKAGIDNPGLSGKAKVAREKTNAIYLKFRDVADMIVSTGKWLLVKPAHYLVLTPAKWMWKGLDAPIGWTGRKLVQVAMPAAYKAGKASWSLAAYEKDADGRKHFKPTFLLHNLAKLAVVWYLAMPLASVAGMGAYYYGTWASPMGRHEDVYFPSTNIFQSQQFLNPGAIGNVIAPRDSIHSVMGSYIKDDKIYPLYYEIDSNGYFSALNWLTGGLWGDGYFPYANNPKYMSSLLNSQSPYGLKCDLETTGFYFSPFSRFLRFRAVQWMDLVPEVVKVNKCIELQEIPDAFKHAVREGRLEKPVLPALSAPVQAAAYQQPAQPGWSGSGFYGKPAVKQTAQLNYG